MAIHQRLLLAMSDVQVLYNITLYFCKFLKLNSFCNRWVSSVHILCSFFVQWKNLREGTKITPPWHFIWIKVYLLCSRIIEIHFMQKKEISSFGNIFFNKAFPAKVLAILGPVVQSIISLTSSLRGELVKCFTTLLPNTLKFFVEKMREAFALQKLLTFFQQKILAYFRH